VELRPLGFGEIFDRAVTLYIRNFIPIAGIVSVVIVPIAVLQYFLDLASVPQWDQMMQILTHPGKTPPAPPVVPAIFTEPSTAALFGVLLLIVWAVWPFALNACTVGVARLYRGRSVDFEACYRASLRPWPAVLGLLVLEAAILVAWYLLFVVSIVLAVLLTVAVAQASVGLAVVLGMLTALFALALLLLLAPLIVAYTFAMNAVVIEERSVFAALGLGFARVFNRQEFWRALLFAIAAGAIVACASMLISVVVLIALTLHLVALEVILSALFRAAVTPLLNEARGTYGSRMFEMIGGR